MSLNSGYISTLNDYNQYLVTLSNFCWMVIRHVLNYQKSSVLFLILSIFIFKQRLDMCTKWPNVIFCNFQQFYFNSRKIPVENSYFVNLNICVWTQYGINVYEHSMELINQWVRDLCPVLNVLNTNLRWPALFHL